MCYGFLPLQVLSFVWYHSLQLPFPLLLVAMLRLMLVIPLNVGYVVSALGRLRKSQGASARPRWKMEPTKQRH